MMHAPPALQVVERTKNHAIAVAGDLVITYAYRGSSEDVAHVTSSVEAIRSAAARRKGKVRLLFVLQDAETSKPPSTNVRSAIGLATRKCEDDVAEVVVVMAGEGFGVAIHRAVMSTVMTISRPSVPIRVVGDVRSALTSLLGPGDASAAVLRLCETELARRGQSG